MEKRYIATLGVVLASICNAAVWAQSPAEQRSLEAAGRVDVSKFYSSHTDVRSRTFPFRGEQVHEFAVPEAGEYRFESEPVGGDSDYRIVATLEDENGQTIASDTAFGRSGGLALQAELSPGEYRLVTEANKFGAYKSGASGYMVTVSALDAQGNIVERGQSRLDDGDGIFGQPGETGEVFVRPGAAVTLGSSAAEVEKAAEARADGEEASRGDSQSSDSEAGSRQPDTILADVRIAYEGEAVSFTLEEPRRVSIQSSSFPGNEGSYRLEARLLDSQGRTIAQDAGSALAGDFQIVSRLQPGEYSVWVDGRRIGSIQGNDSTYELRIDVTD